MQTEACTLSSGIMPEFLGVRNTNEHEMAKYGFADLTKAIRCMSLVGAPGADPVGENWI